MLVLILPILLLEFLLFLPLFWQFRKYITAVLICLNLVWVVWLCAFSGLILLFPFLFLSLTFHNLVIVFKVVNYSRIFVGRMNEKYMKRAGLRSTIYLSIFWIASFVVIMLEFGSSISLNGNVTYILPAVGLLLLLSTTISLYRGKLPTNNANFSDKELPTVSICIPARNETPDLEVCLQSLLANTYPKLEILVLDDCSTDQTPDIIKQFAHGGVRFIKGTEPKDTWLPKNQAYQRLAEEASGEYILFCGVDTRFAPQTIAKLVALILTNNYKMISILPRRLTNNSLAAFVQPMRYWWELTIPRWLTKSPPVLSTCWMINADFLRQFGGFEAVRRSVLPERHFAKLVDRQNNYKFGLANDLIDVQTVKNIEDQRETAIRVRYPQLHKRPELVLLLVMFEIVFLLLPPITTVVGYTLNNTAMFWSSLLASLLLIANHTLIVAISNPANVPLALVNYPFVILTELLLGIESVIKYEFGRVEWKDRNICIPVMHVTKHLPRID